MRIEVPDKLALVANERYYSYQQFFGLSDLLAGNFPESGQKVALCGENSAAWLLALYGGWRHHNIMVPMDYLSTPEELAYMINDCRPALLCHTDKTAQTAQKALEISPYKCALLNLSAFEQPDDILSSDPLDRDNNDQALILYTSGTTGSPKGVQISFGNLEVNLNSGCARPVVRPDGSLAKGCPIFNSDSRCIVVLPLHHVLPLLFTGILPLYSGSSFYLCPSLSGSDLQYTLAKYKITNMIAVPRLYEAICKSIKEAVTANPLTNALYHLTRSVNSLAFSRLVFKKVHQKFGGELRHLISGGAPLSPELYRDLRAFGFEILEGFGMTEAAPLISFSWPGHTRQGTAGQVAPGVEVKIIDGEICARGANITAGYYNRPEETAKILRDGWLHTGDLGTVDESGYITITGRLKELLVLKNGKKVNPAEVETKLIASTTFIKEAAVLVKNGQLHAILVPNTKALTAAGIANIGEAFNNQIVGPYNQQVSPAKRLMGYTISQQELPRTRLGKIKRFELDKLITKLENNNTVPQTEEDISVYPASTQALIRYLTKQLEVPVSLNNHLELDLGMDSLDKVALLSFIEDSFGIPISEPQLATMCQLRQLADYIEQNKTRLEEYNVNWRSVLAKECKSPLPKTGILHNILRFLALGLARECFKLHLSGKENLPQKPVIIAANHQSYADGVLLALLMPRRTFKKTLFLAKQKHFNDKFTQFIARHCNIIVMDINSNIKDSMQKMAQALKTGYNVVIFPEGTRSKNGELAAFKRSFAIVGSELDVPIVPAVIKGAENALLQGSLLPRHGAEISVSFLPPVEAGHQDYEKLTSKIHEEIAEELNKAA